MTPNYSNKAGFKTNFTENELSKIIEKTNITNLDVADGGGYETTQDIFWLPSTYAVGLETSFSGSGGTREDSLIYEAFKDNASRVWPSSGSANWWLRTINGTSSASGVRNVGTGGALVSYYAYNYYAVRPFCLLQSSTWMHWSDSDNAYVLA